MSAFKIQKTNIDTTFSNMLSRLLDQICHFSMRIIKKYFQSVFSNVRCHFLSISNNLVLEAFNIKKICM